jgi:hypothetical protein
VKTNSYKSCRTPAAGEHFTCPSRDTISKLVMKVQTQSKVLKINHVLTEIKLDDIGHRLENSPGKPLRLLA